MSSLRLKACCVVLACCFYASVACVAQAAEPPAASSERITLYFRECPIHQIFEALSRQDKINIIVGKEVNGSISINLHNVTVKEAILRVAEAGGYAVEVRNGGYVVLDRKEIGLDHAQGLKELRSFKVQYSDPKQVAEILSKYLSRYGKITPLHARRLVVIEDTPEFIERARKLLEELDVPPKQVLIEAKILEVTLEDGEAYGVDWSKIFGSPDKTRGKFGTSGLSKGSSSSGPRLGGFFFNLTNDKLDLFLEAQASKGRVRTISSPKLLALENEEAKAVIGDSTGYRVTTTINQVTTESIQFLESGVILKVTPSVDQNGRVLMKIHPEVSSTTLSAGIPSKRSTEFTTELLCENGQSIFIGGLIKKRSLRERTGVPLLGDIPGIGLLFSTTEESIVATETVVIITPYVVNEPQAAAAFSDKENTRLERTSAQLLQLQRKFDVETTEDAVRKD